MQRHRLENALVRYINQNLMKEVTATHSDRLFNPFSDDNF